MIRKYDRTYKDVKARACLFILSFISNASVILYFPFAFPPTSKNIRSGEMRNTRS